MQHVPQCRWHCSPGQLCFKVRLALAALVVAVATADEAVPSSSSTQPLRFLQGHARDQAGNQRKAPGYSRSAGLRGIGNHFDESAKFEPDIGIDRTIWYGDSMASEFRMMDDLDPTAPMDRVSGPQSQTFEQHVTEAMPWTDPKDHDTQFIPNYLYPDAFPAHEGEGCICQEPEDKNAPTKCTCKQEGDRANHLETYHWATMEPIPGTSNFTLKPADVTYNQGDYWKPHVKDGLVPPAETMPLNQYPVQSMGDQIQKLPVMAREDRITRRFAKYMDQVESHKRECDTVSDECTVSCAPGDNVRAALGNTLFDASVVSTHVGNAIAIEFKPKMSEGVEHTLPCDLKSSCTIFRPCIDGSKICTEMEDKHTIDRLENLHETHQCPKGTLICTSVQQIVSATILKKDGKTCKAAPGAEDPFGI